jgi:hypothetical protein
VSAARAEIAPDNKIVSVRGRGLQLAGRDQKIAPVRIVLGAILE